MSTDKPLNVTVPEHQRDIYDEEADQMGFASRAAYVRAMINAGRREFGLETRGEDGEDTTLPGLIERRIIARLSEEGGLDRDDLVAEIEAETTDVLERLDDEDVIDYDVQENGFVVRGGANGGD